jgi:hypothetical protein
MRHCKGQVLTLAKMSGLMQGVCVKCGQVCAVVVQDRRAASACCEIDALEDGGLRIITAAELPDSAPAGRKRGN